MKIDKIILHAGTPKTGTTSLQMTLEEHRSILNKRGVFYPATHAVAVESATHFGETKPKHQWLVEALLAEDTSLFWMKLEDAINQASPFAPIIVLSTEGLFHHWWDFPNSGRAALADLVHAFHVELWVWLREPVAFFTSSYIQMLKNPPGLVHCYGRDWPPERLLDDPWFAKRLDYVGFLDDVKKLFGSERVRAFKYTGSTVHDFLQALGLAELGLPERHDHATLGTVGVELLRLLNRQTLSMKEKAAAVDAITQIDKALGPQSARFQLNPDVRAQVRALCAPGLRRLRDEYGIGLEISND